MFVGVAVLGGTDCPTLLAGSDGGVFAYSTPFLGSAGSLTLNAPVVGIDLGTSRSSISAGNGLNEWTESFVGWPKDFGGIHDLSVVFDDDGRVYAVYGYDEVTLVEIKPDRIILIDITRAGDRLVAVGERGFALLSDDAGETWRSRETPVTRTLTGVSFRDAKVGVAVGRGGCSPVRTRMQSRPVRAASAAVCRQ